MSFTFISSQTGKFVAWPDKSWDQSSLGLLLFKMGKTHLVTTPKLPEGFLEYYPDYEPVYDPLMTLNKEQLLEIAETLEQLPENKEHEFYSKMPWMEKEDLDYWRKYVPRLARSYKVGIRAI